MFPARTSVHVQLRKYGLKRSVESPQNRRNARSGNTNNLGRRPRSNCPIQAGLVRSLLLSSTHYELLLQRSAALSEQGRCSCSLVSVRGWFFTIFLPRRKNQIPRPLLANTRSRPLAAPRMQIPVLFLLYARMPTPATLRVRILRLLLANTEIRVSPVVRIQLPRLLLPSTGMRALAALRTGCIRFSGPAMASGCGPSATRARFWKQQFHRLGPKASSYVRHSVTILVRESV